jgi:hypothetical protein
VTNILIAYQNRTDEGTLSNGTWLSTLPLVNLQNRLVQRVARSNGATLAATKFDMDFGAAKTIGVIALVVHNFSVGAKVRIQADDAADFATPTYNSGWVDVWPAGQIPQALLEWEEDNFWLGTLSANARAGYQSPFIHVPAAAQTYRYWRVEIDDTTNTDGYVHIGRLFMSATWTPTINYSYGAGLVYKDTTPIETSLSGAEYFDVRGKAREFSFTLEGLTNTEAYDIVLQLQRVAGISGEILQIPDMADTTRIPARSYVGRLVDLQPIGNPKPDRFNVQLNVRELI